MAGNTGMSKSPDFVADETDSYCINQVRQFVEDMESLTDLVDIEDYSLSEQLDIEIHKLEEMIACLELLECQIDSRRHRQSILVTSNEIIYQNSNVMERPRRSGIPVPRRVAPKPHHPVSPEIPIPKRTSPGHDCPVSPPLSPPLSPENGVTEQDFDQMEEESSYQSSKAVKSAAGMFGGQAVIRRIPTPNSRRQGAIPKPAPNPEKREKFLETNVDDIFDEPMKSLSEINGIHEDETYDNVDDIDNIPSYEEFLYGNKDDIKIDKEVIQKEGIEADLVLRSDEVLPKSPPLDNSEMDYTILGTISPLNDASQKGDNLKEEMSFVIGRPASPLCPPVDTGLKRCLSPPYEPPRPLSPVIQVVHPTKRVMGNNRNRALPPLPPSRRREAPQAPLGIMCEGCNNCLLELKRQALRLMYQENPRGEAVTMPVESISSLKEKLQVPENGYRFHRNGHCDVCDTHISQLKQEAVTMVQSIQHAQSETSTTGAATSIPQLIGSINLSPRKGVPHVRYGRPVKYGNYLSKSAPIAAQAQAYLEHNNVRPHWNPGHRKYGQMLLRQSQQDRGFPQGGDMYAQGQDHPAMAPGYGRPGHYAVSGAHALSTPYMQQSHPMQMYHPQLQYQQQQQQQQQQHYQQQYHHPQPLQQQQHFSYQPLSHQQLLQQYQHLQPTPPQNPVIHQQPQPYQQPSFTQQYPQFNSQSAPGSPIRVQSPPPRMGRISSPPPSSPSLSSLRSSISPPPSASAAASFFAR